MSQQINLLNPAFARQKKIFTAVTMARALGLLLFGCLALTAYGKHRVGALEAQAREGEALLQQKRLRHATAMTEFAPRKKSAELAAQIAEAEAELASLNHVVNVLERGDFGDTAGFAEYFKALARQSNGDVWLTGLSIGAAGKRLGLQGRALDASMVPAYVGRLTREPVMRGKSFGSLDISRPLVQVAGVNGAAAAEVAAPFLEFSLQAAADAALPGVPQPSPTARSGPQPVQSQPRIQPQIQPQISPQIPPMLPAALGQLLPQAAPAPASPPPAAPAPSRELL